VILVHMFGLCSKVEEIQEICTQHSIALVEDGSHAHGARLRDKHLGTFGRVGVFSLHQRKAISAGDGGVLCTDDHFIYEKVRRLRSFGDKQLSYNYRMTEFAAAVARVGLSRLEHENYIRCNNHAVLASILRNSPVQVVEAPKNVKPVFYSNLLLIDLPYQQQEILVTSANSVGIPLKRTWQPLHKHPHFDRANMLNRIAPWDVLNVNFQDPSTRILPNSEKLQENILFELEGHPLVPVEAMQEAATYIHATINSFS